ncbi:hypothetical protein LCGC14_1121320 [marine sediment metagenome]|uniref:Uncharacterized protein n=1 Tax=marine sediment metagenome TaxID=412755 RepID=A0A0F9PM07_9ZZZZ
MPPKIVVIKSAKSFVDTVDLPNDKATLAAGKWKFSCGLEMVDESIKNTPDNHYVTKDAAIMQLAHTRHHDGLATDYVTAGNHDATATLYFQSQDGVLIDAWCSCGYNPNA